MLFLIEEKRTHAVTLMELMVVIIIIGILAAMAIPMFPRVMETTKAQEAVAALEQIRTAERVYRVEENSYWASSGAGGKAEIKQINDTIRTFLDYRDERNWDYDVVLVGTTGTGFTATAKRKGGRNNGEKITIDEEGDIDKTYWSP